MCCAYGVFFSIVVHYNKCWPVIFFLLNESSSIIQIVRMVFLSIEEHRFENSLWTKIRSTNDSLKFNTEHNFVCAWILPKAMRHEPHHKKHLSENYPYVRQNRRRRVQVKFKYLVIWRWWRWWNLYISLPIEFEPTIYLNGGEKRLQIALRKIVMIVFLSPKHFT